MPGRRRSAEEVVDLLRRIDAAIRNGKTLAQCCIETGISNDTYYRWQKYYDRVGARHVKRLRELEQENAKLRHLVAKLSLEKLTLKEIVRENL